MQSITKGKSRDNPHNPTNKPSTQDKVSLDDIRLSIREIKRQDLRDSAPHILGQEPKRRTAKYDEYFAPDRDERTPSLKVWADGFKDFGDTRKGGDHFVFVQRYAGLGIKEAIAYYSGHNTHFTLNYVAPRPRKPDESVSDGWQTEHHRLLTQFQKALWKARRILKVLKQWGYDLNELQQLGIGYNRSWEKTSSGWVAPGIVYPRYDADGNLVALRIRCPFENKDGTPDILARAMRKQPAKDKYMSATGSKPSLGYYGNLDNLGQGVHWTEGEKDRDNLAQRLQPAANILTMGSAGTTPPSNVLQSDACQLAPYHIIWRDNDDAGLAGANKLKTAIEQTTAAPVLIATVPSGKDVTDFALADGDVNQVLHNTLRWIPHQVSVEYIAEALPDTLPRFTLLQSPTGTGKTHWGADATADGSLVVLGHRVALVKQQAQRFAAFSYLDADQLPQEQHLSDINRVAVTINSLHKLRMPNGAVRPIDYLFIDECEQLFAQILSTSLFNAYESQQALNVLLAFMRTAHHIILADAHVGDATRFILEQVLDTDDTLLHVINTYQQPRPPAHIIRNRGEFLNQLWADLEQGAKVSLPTDSRNDAKDIASLARQKGYNVLLLHSENADELDISTAIGDVDRHLADVDLLIYTPVIGSGVDIQTRFDTQHALMWGGQLSAKDGLQLLRRVRNVQTAITICMKSDPSPDKHNPDQSEQIKQQHLSLYESIYLADRIPKAYDGTGAPLSVEEQLSNHQRLHLELYCIVTADHNAQRNSPAAAYTALLEFEGHAVTVGEKRKPSDAEVAVLRTHKEQREARKEDEKQRILTTEPIPEDELESKKKNGEYIEHEHLPGFQRWEIEQHYGQTITDEIYQDYTSYGPSISIVTDLLSSERDLEEHQVTEFQSQIPLHRMKHRYSRYRAIKALLARLFRLESAGSLTPELVSDNWFSVEDLDTFARYARKHSSKLSLLLGFTPSKYKRTTDMLRAFLALLGLKLESQRTRHNGERRYLYRVCPESLSRRYDLVGVAADHRAVDMVSTAIEIPTATYRSKWMLSESQIRTKPHQYALKTRPKRVNNYIYSEIADRDTQLMTQPSPIELFNWAQGGQAHVV